MDKAIAKSTLERFLAYPIGTSREVLEAFAALPRAIAHFDGEKRDFVYIPGEREDRVLLVAHADTVWDILYEGEKYEQTVKEKGGVYRGKSLSCGIGADDRAGCAMLWLLKDTGHSLLIVDGEEHGQIGSRNIRENYPTLFDELNAHAYAVQLDRREHKNYKVYRLPVSREFISFVERETGYENAGSASRTDIIVLCRDICGVNLSIGYYNEHTEQERLVFDEWYETLTLTERLLSGKQRRFPLVK